MRRLPFLYRLTLLIVLGCSLPAQTILRFDRLPARQGLRYLALAEGRTSPRGPESQTTRKRLITVSTGPLTFADAAQKIAHEAGLAIDLSPKTGLQIMVPQRLRGMGPPRGLLANINGYAITADMIEDHLQAWPAAGSRKTGTGLQWRKAALLFHIRRQAREDFVGAQGIGKPTANEVQTELEIRRHAAAFHKQAFRDFDDFILKNMCANLQEYVNTRIIPDLQYAKLRDTIPMPRDIATVSDDRQDQQARLSILHLPRPGSPAERTAQAQLITVISRAPESDFSALIKRHSACISRHRDGDIGWISQASPLLPKIREATATLAPGRISPPIMTRRGCFFVRITAMTDLQEPASVDRKLKDKREERLEQRIRAKARIEIRHKSYESLLPKEN